MISGDHQFRKPLNLEKKCITSPNLMIEMFSIVFLHVKRSFKQSMNTFPEKKDGQIMFSDIKYRLCRDKKCLLGTSPRCPRAVPDAARAQC